MSLNKFTDTSFKFAVRQFVYDEIVKNCDISLSDDTFRFRVRYNFSNLYNFWGDCKLSDITPEFLIDVLNKSEQDYYINTAVKFLVYAYGIGIITDEKFNRLYYFRSKFVRQSLISDLLYLMQDDGFIKFSNANNFCIVDKITERIYFSRINTEEFKDSNIAKSFEKSFLEFKTSEEFARSSLVNLCRGYHEAAKQLFTAHSANEITKEVLLSSIKIKPNEEADFYSSLARVIVDTAKLGIEYDEELLYGCKIVMNYGSRNKNTINKIFSVDNLYKWYSNKNTHSGRLYYINIESEEIRNTWKEFLNNYRRTSESLKIVCEQFQDSLGDIMITNIQDLNFETFKKQIQYFSTLGKDDSIAPIPAFYTFVSQKYNSKIFSQSNVDAKILQRVNLANELVNGYEYISYNPLEEVPTTDKWIFSYSNMADSNSVEERTFSKLIDLTDIECIEYRYWYKHYLWHNSSGLGQRMHCFSVVKYALNYLYRIKTGKIITFTSKKSDNMEITTGDAFIYKNHILSLKDNNRTRMAYIYNLRNLLNHINDNNLSVIEKGVFVHLTYTLSNDYNNTLPLTDDDLNKLSLKMKNNVEISKVHAIYYAIFYLALETEFRPSQILSLKINCVQETAKPDEYVVVSKTKTSTGELLDQPITIYVKRHIDEIISMTNEYRSECIYEDINQYLFIGPTIRQGTYAIITPNNMNKYLSKCCKDVGIPQYNMSNLRDTHMTKSEEFVIRNQMSDLEQNILTGHRSPNIDNKHYVETNLKELLESVHGIIIGNITVDGRIVKEVDPSIATSENEVSNSCGYCTSNQCHNYSYLDCMICKDFITMPDRLPYFKEQIKIIDFKILNSNIPHDKEDFVNIKLLLLHYVEEIMKIMEAMINE